MEKQRSKSDKDSHSTEITEVHVCPLVRAEVSVSSGSPWNWKIILEQEKFEVHVKDSGPKCSQIM